MTASDRDLQALGAAIAAFTALSCPPDGQPAAIVGQDTDARVAAVLVAMSGVILPRCLSLTGSGGQRLDLYLCQRALHGWNDSAGVAHWPVTAQTLRSRIAALAQSRVTLTTTRWAGPGAAATTGLPVSAIARAPSPGDAPRPIDHLARFIAALDTSEAALIRIEGDSVAATEGAEPGLSRLITFAEEGWDDLLADPGPPDTAQLIVLTTADATDPGQAIVVAKAGDTRVLLRFGAHLAVPVAALWLNCGPNAA